MNVTVRRPGPEPVYVVTIRPGRLLRPVTIQREGRDWQLHDGDHGCWRFATFSDAKTWLLGPEGQAWLGQLPKEAR